MKMMNIFKLPCHKAGLLVEAMFWQYFFRIIIIFFPWKYYRRIFLDKTATQMKDPISIHRDSMVDNIAWAVKLSRRCVLWKNVCLTAAMSARTMLLLRGKSSTLYLGVKKDVRSSLSSHAWLKCGETLITGGTGEGYVLVSTFK